jgi:4-hydroxybenzoate polyprenyltransferase
MKLSRFSWNEFIYGGHWLSIGASAIALSTMILLNFTIKWEFLLIVYLGTQCIYNYNHYKEIDKDSLNNSERVGHLKKYYIHLPTITAIYGIMYFSLLLYFSERQSVFFGGFLLILGLLFTYKGKQISKKIIGFKSIYTAFSWALLPIFTAIYTSYKIDETLFLFFLFVFLRWMVNTIAFDIKDIKSDKKEKLLTVPIVFKYKLIKLLHVLNFLSFAPIVIGVYFGYFSVYVFALFLLFFYSFYYIGKSKDENVDVQSVYYVFVDGEYYYWPILLLLGLIMA